LSTHPSSTYCPSTNIKYKEERLLKIMARNLVGFKTNCRV